MPVIYIFSTIVDGFEVFFLNIFRVLQNLENEFAGLKEEMVCIFSKHVYVVIFFLDEPLVILWSSLDGNGSSTSRTETFRPEKV
jgi:hypothetical protein